MGKSLAPRYLVMDKRAIFDPEDALVLTCADSLSEAIDDLRDQGQGAILEDGEHLVYWRSWFEGKCVEWDARDPKKTSVVESGAGGEGRCEHGKAPDEDCVRCDDDNWDPFYDHGASG